MKLEISFRVGDAIQTHKVSKWNRILEERPPWEEGTGTLTMSLKPSIMNR